MYFVEIDPQGEIQRISQELGDLHAKAPQVLANALNATGRRASTLIKNAIKKRYTYGRKDKLKDIALSQKASKANPSATISVTSDAPHLSDFKIEPKQPSSSDYGAVKAQVFKSGNMTAIEGNGVKAFIARFSNGKVAVVQRVPGQRYKSASALSKRLQKYGKSADPTRIKAFYGPRVTSMAKTVYEDGIDEEIASILQDNIRKQIAKTIERAARQNGG